MSSPRRDDLPIALLTAKLATNVSAGETASPRRPDDWGILIRSCPRCGANHKFELGILDDATRDANARLTFLYRCEYTNLFAISSLSPTDSKFASRVLNFRWYGDAR